MSGPQSSIDKSILHESDGWGFDSRSGRDIFCLKIFDTSQDYPFVCRNWMLLPAQLTFQMLTLLKKYHEIQDRIKMYVICLFASANMEHLLKFTTSFL